MDFKIGDLVRLSLLHDIPLRGIILDIYEDPDGEFEANLLTILWTDGDKTEEFPVDLEVVCK